MRQRRRRQNVAPLVPVQFAIGIQTRLRRKPIEGQSDPWPQQLRRQTNRQAGTEARRTLRLLAQLASVGAHSIASKPEMVPERHYAELQSIQPNIATSTNTSEGISLNRTNGNRIPTATNNHSTAVIAAMEVWRLLRVLSRWPPRLPRRLLHRRLRSKRFT